MSFAIQEQWHKRYLKSYAPPAHATQNVFWTKEPSEAMVFDSLAAGTAFIDAKLAPQDSCRVVEL